MFDLLDLGYKYKGRTRLFTGRKVPVATPLAWGDAPFSPEVLRPRLSACLPLYPGYRPGLGRTLGQSARNCEGTIPLLLK
jgi:hypothetical protein